MALPSLMSWVQPAQTSWSDVVANRLKVDAIKDKLFLRQKGKENEFFFAASEKVKLFRVNFER